MTPDDLRALTDQLGISQVDLSRLIEVMPRAVSIWLSGERAIPGSVVAYLSLLASLPSALRAAEFARLGAQMGTLRSGL